MTKFTARMTDDWIPLPEEVLKLLGWVEGDSIELEVVDCGDNGFALLVTFHEPAPAAVEN